MRHIPGAKAQFYGGRDVRAEARIYPRTPATAIATASATTGLLAVMLLAAVIPCATAQTAASPQRPQDPRHYDATHAGEVVGLGPLWLFQEGDDPWWAAANFDDSKWPVVTAGRHLVDQGYPNANQIWYRTHVLVPADAGQLLLGVEAFYGSYEVFVNGTRIGGEGSLTGRGEARAGRMILFGIPKEAVRSGELIIAIHGVTATAAYALATGAAGIVADTKIVIGGPAALTPQTFASYITSVTNEWIYLFLVLFVVIAVLTLYRALPEQKEYLFIAWCGAFSLVSCCSLLFGYFKLRLPASGVVYGIEIFTASVYAALMYEVVMQLVHRHPPAWMRVLQGLLVFDALLFELCFAGLVPLWVCVSSLAAVHIALDLALPVYLVREVHHGNRDAPVLLAFQLVSSVLQILYYSSYFLYKAHLVTAPYNLPPPLHVGRYSFPSPTITTLYFWGTLLVIVMLRTIRLAREKAEIAAEVEAARTVQQMLIPVVPPVTPGFVVESVYLPARQVGGDFYLVAPSKDGSLLIVTGDVSGKGLQAAMVVSTILGALRNESSRSPTTVLANLNQVLLGQVRGFVTCIAALIAPDGRITLANAGNPAPYLNGRELAVCACLPLGIIAGIAYDETGGHLALGDNLTFVSDGVVEATAPVTRELFGFERTQAISSQAANAIAEAARAFAMGAPQADDITILTVVRV